MILAFNCRILLPSWVARIPKSYWFKKKSFAVFREMPATQREFYTSSDHFHSWIFHRLSRRADNCEFPSPSAIILLLGGSIFHVSHFVQNVYKSLTTSVIYILVTLALDPSESSDWHGFSGAASHCRALLASLRSC